MLRKIKELLSLTTEVLVPINSVKETQHIISCLMTKSFGILSYNLFVTKKEIFLWEIVLDCILPDLNLMQKLVYRFRKVL